ncbi:ATP-binding protein [Thalassotalea fusca]
MLSHAFKPFRRIGFKLFLGFWIIATVSIAATRIISAQLEQESVILPPLPFEMERLKKIAKRIEKRPDITAQQLVSISMRKHGTNLIVKQVGTNKVIKPQRRLPRHLINYIEKNTFSTLTTIQFPYARITGPLLVELEHEPYQIYLTARGHPPHISSLVLQLPAWARVIIPLIVSLVLSWLLARSLSRPIKAMQQAAAKFGDGDLSSRVDAAFIRKDELGELAHSFNQMALKLEKNISAHQRLLGDVSHELRSPMTRLQIALGLAQKSQLDPKALTDYLNRCEKEVSRLDEMIADVLSLSRLENTINHSHKEKEDLCAVIRHCVDDCQFIGQEKQISIQANLPDTLVTVFDVQLIASAISNIITNAIKYSPPQTTVRITLTTVQDSIIIEITDEGTGVPESSLAQLFEPFYRVAEARDRDTGGTGLGLAIAKQAVIAHDGTISARNNDGNGLTITLTLPIFE